MFKSILEPACIQIFDTVPRADCRDIESFKAYVMYDEYSWSVLPFFADLDHIISLFPLVFNDRISATKMYKRAEIGQSWRIPLDMLHDLEIHPKTLDYCKELSSI